LQFKKSTSFRVKFLNGDSFEIRVHSPILVADLKEVIFTKRGIPTNAQNIIYKRKQVRDIEYLNALDENEIYLVLPLIGGGNMLFFFFFFFELIVFFFKNKIKKKRKKIKNTNIIGPKFQKCQMGCNQLLGQRALQNHKKKGCVVVNFCISNFNFINIMFNNF